MRLIGAAGEWHVLAAMWETVFWVKPVLWYYHNTGFTQNTVSSTGITTDQARQWCR